MPLSSKNIGPINDEKACAVLNKLHAESTKEVGKILWKYLPYYIRLFSGKKLPWDRLQHMHDRDYLASNKGSGVLLHVGKGD